MELCFVFPFSKFVFQSHYLMPSLSIGTPLKSSAIKVMLLGSGELGKEVVIEFQRYGVEVIAVDRYDHAPAMQVAHRSYAIPMLDGKALRSIIEKEKPDYIVPEVEAIATDTLVELESEGFNVIPTATAARLTMNREGIRTLAAEKLKVKHGDEPTITANYFSAQVDGLSAGGKYVYRVGTAGAWSEWYQIQMPDASKQKLSFIYFGDAQNDVKSMWSRVIREAYRTFPKIDFMLHAGDLINRHDRDIEWGEWFYAGNFIHATVPSVMTPGNHEYGKGVVLSPQWRKQFNLPMNGPKGLEETCYVVNYSNLKVISLDAEQIDESPVYLEKQRRWLDSVLTSDPKKWTAITFHYPVFSTKPNRDNENLRNHFKPLFDKHKVDIVLQGHDHAYGRGMVSNVPTGQMKKDETSGTMYVVSVSGPKMYDISNDPWMQRKARSTQLFQIISIDNNTLSYQAFTAHGELYDAFDLIKSRKEANRLVNRIPPSAERL